MAGGEVGQGQEECDRLGAQWGATEGGWRWQQVARPLGRPTGKGKGRAPRREWWAGTCTSRQPCTPPPHCTRPPTTHCPSSAPLQHPRTSAHSHTALGTRTRPSPSHTPPTLSPSPLPSSHYLGLPRVQYIEGALPPPPLPPLSLLVRNSPYPASLATMNRLERTERRHVVGTYLHSLLAQGARGGLGDWAAVGWQQPAGLGGCLDCVAEQCGAAEGCGPLQGLPPGQSSTIWQQRCSSGGAAVALSGGSTGR